MSRATPARRAALGILCSAAERDAYARELLDRSSEVRALDPRDAAFARRLVLGVTACRGCLDDALDRYIAKPGKVTARVRAALRIAAFELVYLGTAPRISVSQGVELVREQARSAAGMANAVLRRVADGREAFLSADDVDDAVMRALVSKARRAGLPVWLLREIEGAIGQASACDLCAAELDPAPIAVCLNPLRSKELPGVSAVSPLGDGLCRIVEDMPALVGSGALERADAVVSDANAQAVAREAVRPGSCLEIGAGRGTKTFVMAAEARYRGIAREHAAVDLYEAKRRQNMDRLRLAGLEAGVRVVAGDATDLDSVLADLDAEAGERRLFDTVLADAPCSGTGTMRRHPEIPWRLTKADVRGSLPALQLRMLEEASRRVAPGGVLVYATCSVLRTENDGVVEAFLSSEKGASFVLEEREQTVPAPGAFDGHFHTVLRRNAR